MPNQIALTVHAGFYPQLAKSLTKKYSFNRSVSKGKGVTSVRGASREFAKHIDELTNEYTPEQTESLLSPMGMPVKTAFGRKLGPLSGLMGAILGAIPGARKREMKGTFLNKQIERGQSWKEILGSDAKKYQARSKKYSLKGNYLWYTDKAQGPKAIAQAVYSAGQSFNFSKAESWYARHVGQQTANVPNWADDILGLSGVANRNLNQADIDRVAARSNDEAESVILSGHTHISDPPPVSGKPRTSDYVMGGRRMESTEQPGMSHGLMKDPPLKDIESGIGEKQKEEMAQTWQDFMDKDNIAVWNRTVSKILKISGTRQRAIEKAQDLSAKSLNKQIKAAGRASADSPVSLKPGTIDRHGRVITAHTMSKSQMQFLKHSLVNSATTNRSRWREGIPIGPRDPNTGNRVYASTPLDFNRSTFQFRRSGNVTILDGVSHGHALRSLNDSTFRAIAGRHYEQQQMTYAHGHNVNQGTVSHLNGISTQIQNGVGVNGIQRTANVSFSKEGAEAWMQIAINRLITRLQNGIESEQAQIKERLGRQAASDSNNADLFWAAPYIGVERGLYVQQ